MKVKIKGLVFVGFAAMIFAANAALADNENTVTSKSFTEATYHKKANADYQVSKNDGTWQALATTVTADGQNAVTAGGIASYVGGAINEALENGLESGTYVNATYDENDQTTTVDLNANKITDALPANGLDSESTNLVTEGVIKQAIANASQVTNFISQTVGTATDKAPSENAVNQYVTLKGVKVDGTALAIDSTDKTVDLGAAAGKDVDATITAGSTSTDVPTTAAVAAYVAAQPGSQQYTGGNLITVNDHEISTTAEVNVLEGVKVNGAALTVDQDKNVNVTVAPGTANGTIAVNGTDVAVTNAEVTTNKVNSTTGLSASSTDTQYPSAKTVYDAIQNATGGATIPAQDSSVCTATTPCALVDEAGNLNWRTMATATHNGGTCGNASAICPTTGA